MRRVHLFLGTLLMSMAVLMLTACGGGGGGGNSAPTDITLTGDSVLENSAGGTTVGTLATVDADAGDSHAYTLTDDAGGRFAVSGATLQVAGGATLDYETATSHNITVRSTDSGGSSIEKIFIISVIDVVEPPPPASCDDAAVTNDIPFQYTLTPDHLAIQTPGGVLKTLIGPWGAHTQPHTGHAEGDAKANWSGLFATRYDELTELAGDGDGVCQKGEVCGLPASVIDARIPQYVAPDNNLKIWWASVVTTSDTYYGSVLQWRIESSLCNYGYKFGHVGKVAEDLRNKMVAAGYVDPWTVTGVTSNLITGDAILLNKGESIGVPQIFAQEIAGHAGYYKGGGAFLQSPWAQIEFVGHHVYIEPFYAWLPTTLQNGLRSILYADASNPDSFRYDNPYLLNLDWLWRAEVTLWTALYSDYNDFSSIFARLGGWFENNPGGCTAGSALCDETFSIFPIIKSSPLYDPGLYDSTAVSYLVNKQRPTVAPYVYKWGEVIEPAIPNGLSGSMTIKWRIENFTPVLNYQAISYYLNPAAKLLKIRWGSIVADRAAAVAPAVPTDSDSCNGATLTCLNNDGWWR